MDTQRVKTIFADAMERGDFRERGAYLDLACGADGALRAEVESLLSAAEATDALRCDNEGGLVPSPEAPGSLVGHFRLVRQIGEGGVGVVFLAEQERPVRRQVALKVIKFGMDTRQVIARFEAERQALAMMDHPNIARVFDAGATRAGRPYFAMELVSGVPVTEYCDANNLSIRDRLELFAQVCAAVQHAHHKGVIHRDLKPSNVLVATHDGKAVPKVIDFGIAKATQARLTEKTLFTEFRQMVGTPEYMSPEQADGGLDVDTRSDIYSMGVLLYELLSGTPPFDPKELRSKAFAEMQRIIRDVDPPAPSTRLRGPRETLSCVAAQRAVEPRKLEGILRGELDWIVMRCLEKDRTRRYETASMLAEDIQRFLADEPVLARQPTRRYRMRKFVHRNKAAVAAMATVFALIVATLVTLAVSVTRIRRASESKDRALAVARQAVDQMLIRTADQRLANIPRAQPLRRALLEDALGFYDGFVAQAADDPAIQRELGRVLVHVGDIQFELAKYEAAIASYRRAADVFERLHRQDPERDDYAEGLASAEHNWGYALHTAPGYDRGEAATHLRKAVALYQALERRDPSQPRRIEPPLCDLAVIAQQQGDWPTARARYREAIAAGERYVAARPENLNAATDLCWAYVEFAESLPKDPQATAEAEAVIQRGVGQATDLVRKDPKRSASHYVLGRLYTSLATFERRNGQYAQAFDRFRAAHAESAQACEAAPASQNTWGGLGFVWAVSMQNLNPPEQSAATRWMRRWLTSVRPVVPNDVLPQSELLSRALEVAGYLRQAHRDGEEADAFDREVGVQVRQFVERLPRSPADREEAAHLLPGARDHILEWLDKHPGSASAEAIDCFRQIAKAADPPAR